jgi:hypothetical protein
MLDVFDLLELEVLVGKLLPKNGSTASPITLGEVAALDHEVLDDAVENAPGISFLKET